MRRATEISETAGVNEIMREVAVSRDDGSLSEEQVFFLTRAANFQLEQIIWKHTRGHADRLMYYGRPRTVSHPNREERRLARQALECILNELEHDVHLCALRESRKKSRRVRYFASDEDGLSSGTFFRVQNANACAKFVDGQYMGNDIQLSDVLDDKFLEEFTRELAEELIPGGCLYDRTYAGFYRAIRDATSSHSISNTIKEAFLFREEGSLSLRHFTLLTTASKLQRRRLLSIRPSAAAYRLIKEIIFASDKQCGFLRWAMYGNNMPSHPIHELPPDEVSLVWEIMKTRAKSFRIEDKSLKEHVLKAIKAVLLQLPPDQKSHSSAVSPMDRAMAEANWRQRMKKNELVKHWFKYFDVEFLLQPPPDHHHPQKQGATPQHTNPGPRNVSHRQRFNSAAPTPQ
jgi:hypothetical protein